MGFVIENPDVWKLVGHLEGEGEYGGIDDINWGAIETKKQVMTLSASLNVFRLEKGDRSEKYDYYLVTGTFFHSIKNSPDDPSSNWLSVGYYANYMKLSILCAEGCDEDIRVHEFGPNSTVNTATTSFSIGGDIKSGTSGGEPYAVGGVSAQIGFSFTSSEVSFATRGALRGVHWHTSLPCVGWVSPAIPANPGKASYAGYIWNPGVIFRVPSGKLFRPAGECEVQFEFNYTRGISHDKKERKINLVYTPNVPENSLATSDLASEQLPTIIEALKARCTNDGKVGTTDSFYYALLKTGLDHYFNDNSTKLIVYAPSNKTIVDYFSKASSQVEVAKYTSVFAESVLKKFLEERIKQRGLMTDAAILQAFVGDHREVVSCSDGVLVIGDSFEPNDAFSRLPAIT